MKRMKLKLMHTSMHSGVQMLKEIKQAKLDQSQSSVIKREGTFVLFSQSVVRTQMMAIESLERQLRVASTNNTALQRQQAQLMESVHTLITMVASTAGTCTHTHTLTKRPHNLI